MIPAIETLNLGSGPKKPIKYSTQVQESHTHGRGEGEDEEVPMSLPFPSVTQQQSQSTISSSPPTGPDPTGSSQLPNPNGFAENQPLHLQSRRSIVALAQQSAARSVRSVLNKSGDGDSKTEAGVYSSFSGLGVLPTGTPDDEPTAVGAADSDVQYAYGVDYSGETSGEAASALQLYSQWEREEQEALTELLLAWYNSGYAAAKYEGLLARKKERFFTLSGGNFGGGGGGGVK